MSTQFSVDCKYFAQITIDGKIKIWDTASNALKQEFTPNLHLTTPCTCLHWIHSKSQVSIPCAFYQLKTSINIVRINSQRLPNFLILTIVFITITKE